MIIGYITTNSDGPARQVAEEIEREHGVKAVPVRADISKKDGCSQIIQAAQEHFSDPQTGKLQIDIIIHNAAVLYVGSIEEVVPEEFHHIYEVNVLGPTLLTAACIPYLPHDRSGRIVMVSSINPKVGTPHTTLYSGTKAALEALARVWCRELAERATVNTINPGPVLTDMYVAAPDEPKKWISQFNPLTPLVAVRETDSPEVRKMDEKFGGRAAYPHEIANMVAAICSPEFGWCTGSLISCNGGLTFGI